MTLDSPTVAPRARLIRLVHPVGVAWRRHARTVWQTILVSGTVMFVVVGAVTTFTGFGNRTYVTQTAPKSDRVAEGFAVDVATVWLSWDETRPAARKATVTALLGSDGSGFGWDGHGLSIVSAAEVADTFPHPVDNSVTVAVRVTVNGVVRIVFVPVGHSPSGDPTLVGAPSFGAAPRSSVTAGKPLAELPHDDLATTAATPTVEGFLKAWGIGAPDLPVFAAEGFVPPAGPGLLRLVKAQIVVPPGGSDRVATVIVRWADAETRTYPSAYLIGLHTSGNRWTVTSLDVSPSTPLTDIH